MHEAASGACGLPIAGPEMDPPCRGQGDSAGRAAQALLTSGLQTPSRPALPRGALPGASVSAWTVFKFSPFPLSVV